jgi:hypothetical protein
LSSLEDILGFFISISRYEIINHHINPHMCAVIEIEATNNPGANERSIEYTMLLTLILDLISFGNDNTIAKIDHNIQNIAQEAHALRA